MRRLADESFGSGPMDRIDLGDSKYVHPSPFTLRLNPLCHWTARAFTLHPTLHTLHSTPYTTLHPNPTLYTLHPAARRLADESFGSGPMDRIDLGDSKFVHPSPYRGTSLTRNRPTLGPYSRTMPRALWGS